VCAPHVFSFEVGEVG